MQTDYLQLEKLLSDESFQRWISKTASETENKKWSEWLNSDQKNRDTFEDAMRLWSAVQFHSESAPDADSEWNQLSNRLKFRSEPEPSVLLRASKKRTDRTPTSRAARWRYLAIAAGLLLIIFLWRQLIKDEQAEFIQFVDVRTDFGQSQDILLPERARIVLNANSTIEYPHSIANLNTIKVELRGEAYFEVFPQDEEKQNFIVKTNDGEIHVLGTKFV
ncbi:hypothetical protein GF337_14195, partial [candidate division KSB1 bacterium]|nr:hypothetical protein [candidate division KSB1 bacterium]